MSCSDKPGCFKLFLKCCMCLNQFAALKGMLSGESHLPRHLWLQTVHLKVSSKKGIITTSSTA